jgi:hypothetical protein
MIKVDCVCIGFDGTNVYCLPRAKRALKTNCNIVDPDRQSTTYESRLVKYAKRNFKICVPGYDKKRVKYISSWWELNPEDEDDSIEELHGGVEQEMNLTQRRTKTGLAKVLALIEGRGLHTNGFNSRTDVLSRKGLNDLHDYDQIHMSYKRDLAPHDNYSKIHNTVLYLHDKFGACGHFLYDFNSVENVLSPRVNRSDLPDKIEWIKINPGRQYIGSFHPHNRNFYKDAYQLPQELPKTPNSFNFSNQVNW